MKQLLTGAALLLLAACQNNEAPKIAATTSGKKASAKELYEPKVETGIEGYYTGLFIPEGEDNYLREVRITVRIDSVRGETIYGWSLVAGNGRPFQGTVQREGANWVFTAREPGNDAHDGTFSGRFVDSTLAGSWAAFDPKVKIPRRRFDLQRRRFRYNPAAMLDASAKGYFNEATYDEKKEEGEMLSDAVFELNASTQTLKPSDLENLYKGDLEILRNTVYARHGYSFRNARIRSAFDQSVEWYMPVSADVTAQLTPLELKNIALIKRYEGHAEKYYDSFGR